MQHCLLSQQEQVQQQRPGSWQQTLRSAVLQHQQGLEAAAAAAAACWALPVQQQLQLAQVHYWLLLLLQVLLRVLRQLLLLWVRLAQHLLLLLHQQGSKPWGSCLVYCLKGWALKPQTLENLQVCCLLRPCLLLGWQCQTQSQKQQKMQMPPLLAALCCVRCQQLYPAGSQLQQLQTGQQA